MIVLEALGELVEVFGSSRIDQEGRKSTKRCTCQRFGASQEAVNSAVPHPGRFQQGSESSPGRLRGIPLEASRASLIIIVQCLESL